MTNFWDFNVWGGFFLVATLLVSLLLGNALKKNIPFLQESLIPTSVIGGLLLLIFSTAVNVITGKDFFNMDIFGGNGYANLAIITYHALALVFIASSFKASDNKMTKERSVEIFNTGVTTVSTYLIQAIFGLGIGLIVALLLTDFLPAAGVLLPFGYGQGTGQALNYGNIYETEYGFVGGKSMGLTIAALGFLFAALGGVIHLNILRRKGKIKVVKKSENMGIVETVEGENEIPMQDSIDKMTVQLALIAVAYGIAFGMMYLLGLLLPGMKSTIFGFNFLLGVLSTMLVKMAIKFLKKKNIVKKTYVNNFLMTRASNLFYDVMVVAGIAAIRLDLIENYWGVILILGGVGFVITYIYNRIVAHALFPHYEQEQFLAMYGMLTGTASTGIILLREIDGEFKSPVSDNLVYQNLPAIVFGFPMMLLATLAASKPIVTFIILVAFFAVMNVILFRSKIFKRKKKVTEVQEQSTQTAA